MREILIVLDTQFDIPFIDAYHLVFRAVIVLNSIMVTPVAVVAAVAATAVDLNAINGLLGFIKAVEPNLYLVLRLIAFGFSSVVAR